MMKIENLSVPTFILGQLSRQEENVYKLARGDDIFEEEPQLDEESIVKDPSQMVYDHPDMKSKFYKNQCNNSLRLENVTLRINLI